MPDRPADSPDVNPARVAGDPLLAEIADLLSYLDLHLGRYPWTQLTTRQKELLADLIDSDHVLDPGDPDAGPWFVPRWWREDYVEPDADDHDWRAPDPFGDRPGEPVTYDRPSMAAHDIAHHATLGSSGPFLLEEQLAVYEWALRSAQPFRNTAGDIVAGMAVFPSANDARAFLAGYRAARGR